MGYNIIAVSSLNVEDLLWVQSSTVAANPADPSLASPSSADNSGHTSPTVLRRNYIRTRSKSLLMRRNSVQSMEEDVIATALAPCVDGRIICLTPEVCLFLSPFYLFIYLFK